VTVIKINAITVPADSGDELAKRFAARAGAVDQQEGFEGFELLRPTDERTTWLVVTRWRDEDAFQAWVDSPAFGHGHQGPRAEEGHGGQDAGHGGHGGHGGQGGQDAGHGGQGGHPGHGGQAPLAMSSELWSYEIAGGSAASADRPG
jgi:heme oxygenase (mycobilin-producing)